MGWRHTNIPLNGYPLDLRNRNINIAIFQHITASAILGGQQSNDKTKTPQ